MSVQRLAWGDHLTGRRVQRRKQSGGAVPDGVVGDSIELAQTHGQQGLCPVQVWICIFSSTQNTIT